MSTKPEKETELRTKPRTRTTSELVINITNLTRKVGSTPVVFENVRYGKVTMKIKRPSATTVLSNVAAGQKALERARTKILRPGVTITVHKGVPLYSADPDHPSTLIRKLDGKVQRGRFVDGKFKAAKAA
jgi:hypothetical protein